MRYVSLDLETTGLEPKQPDRILQIAMVVEDSSRSDVIPVECLPSFSAIVIPDGEITGSLTALAMNSWILIAIEWHQSRMSYSNFTKRYKELGIPDITLEKAFHAKNNNIFWNLEETLCHADNWLNNQFGIKEKINVAGKNVAGFDMQFLPPAFASRFRHRVIDPGSVFIDWSKDRVDDSNEIARRTGSFSVSHDALGDARDVITWLRHSYPKSTQ